MKRFLCSIIVLAMVFAMVFAFGVSASASTTITDLTGTTWVLNSTRDISTLNLENYTLLDLHGTAYFGGDPSDLSAFVVREFVSFYLLSPSYFELRTGTARPYWANSYYSSSVSCVYRWEDGGNTSLHSIKDTLLNTISFTGGTDATNANLISWLYANGELQGGTVYDIPSGYYRFKSVPTLTYDTVASIGDGNEIIYPMPEGTASVTRYNDVTYINDITFRLAELTENGYTLQVGYYDPNHDTIFVRVHTIVYDGLLYTIYNDDAESFSHFVIPTDVEVDELGKTLFNDMFNYFADPNVDLGFADILVTLVKSVVQALSVDIFGYFSLLDVIKVFIGGSFVVWLLKLLAGG